MDAVFTKLPLLRVWLLALLLVVPGCFSERDFAPHPKRWVRLAQGEHLTTRAWAARLNEAAKEKRLLPPGRDMVLTTEELAAGVDKDGAVVPVDVWKRFGLDPEKLDSIFWNLHGIEQTAQTVSPMVPVTAGHIMRESLAGYTEVEVPVNGVKLAARIGVPEKENEIAGSWVVYLHGLFGTLDGKQVNHELQVLRGAGHHVLALEMRGHGQTQWNHPEYAITFGILESGDLLETARWLKREHGATRVGLVAFSLTGFEALLTAWLDGTNGYMKFRDMPLRRFLPGRDGEPAFNGGMLIASAPVGLMDTAGRFDTKVSLIEAPVKATFQAHVTKRLEEYKGAKGYTMWDLAREEIGRSPLSRAYTSFESAQEDLREFLDLSRENWRSGAERMESVRVPVLMLNSANDPLASAQGVANLFSRQNNANIGVILAKEGGHIGFPAFSADYYYSVMLNFFDPRTAPVMR